MATIADLTTSVAVLTSTVNDSLARTAALQARLDAGGKLSADDQAALDAAVTQVNALCAYLAPPAPATTAPAAPTPDSVVPTTVVTSPGLPAEASTPVAPAAN